MSIKLLCHWYSYTKWLSFTGPSMGSTSYHAVYESSLHEALTRAVASGFSGVQVAAESPHLGFDSLTNADADAAKKYAGEHGLRISVHAPDDSTSLFQVNARLAEGVIGYFHNLIETSVRVGASILTLHSGRPVTFPTDTSQRTRIPPADEPIYRRAFEHNLARVLELVAGRLIVCIENCTMDAFVRQCVAPHLGRVHLCWDIPKTWSAGRLDEELDSFLWANLRFVRQVHIHDAADGVSHMAVGAGRIDFLRFRPLLESPDVLDFCHEVRPIERAIASRDALADMMSRWTDVARLRPPAC